MTLTWTLLLDADMTLEGWQYSALTDADLLRIDQENVPELGRFMLAQVSSANNEFLNIQGYPARSESVRVTPERVTEEARLIAVEHNYSQYPDNIPGNWQVKIYGAKADFQPPINPTAVVLTLDPRVAGAIPLGEKGIPLGVATLNEDGVVPDDQLPNVPDDQLPNSEWMELFGANLEATDALALQISGHTSNTSNPHQVTLAQIGGEPSGAETRANAYTDLKISELPSSTSPTLESLGAEPVGAAAAAIAAHEAETDPHNQYVMDAELAIHTTNLSNPHNVTLTQIGAEPSGAETKANAYTDQKIGALDYPTNHLHIWGYGKAPAGKTFSNTTQSASELGRYATLSNGAIGDTVEYEVFLKTGAYTLTVYGHQNTTRAIAAFYVDNVFIGSVDYYAPVVANRKVDTINFAIANAGLHSIKVICAGKNWNANGTTLGLSVIRIDPQTITTPNPFVPFRINCGATANYTDPQGNLWTPNLFDDYQGRSYDLEAQLGAFTVQNTDKQNLYKFEYSRDTAGSFSYNLPIYQPGTGYELKLYFAENYHNGAGLRVGSASLNGSTLLSNFDIFAEAGGKNKALVKTFANLTLSSCQIVFTNTLINAIELARNV